MTVVMIDNDYGNPHHEAERIHVRSCPVYGGVALVFGDDETEINCSEATMFDIMRAIAAWGGCRIYTPSEHGDLIEWLTDETLEAQRTLKEVGDE